MLYTWAGPEIVVATTKAYSTQLMMYNSPLPADKPAVLRKRSFARCLPELIKLLEYVSRGHKGLYRHGKASC